MADLPPSQSSIDALNIATPNLADLPQRTSTYERPFTREGNYLVLNCNHLSQEEPRTPKLLLKQWILSKAAENTLSLEIPHPSSGSVKLF